MASVYTGTVLRFNASTGSFIDVFASGTNASPTHLLFAPDNDTLIAGCWILENEAGAGGGIYLDHWSAGRTTIRNTAIIGNRSTGSGAAGLESRAALAELIDSEVEENVANDTNNDFAVGGISANYLGSMLIRRSSIVGNQSPSGTAGIFIGISAMMIENSTISGNTTGGSGVAGGITIGDGSNQGGNARIRFTTITDNTSGYAGGGIRLLPTEFIPADATVSATIIAGNDAPYSPDASGSFASGGDNVIGNDGGYPTGFTSPTDQVGTPANPIDPELGALAFNGGPTQTHAPSVTSPAVDAAVCDGVTEDQRGSPRPVVDCDAGAVELPEPGTLVGLAAGAGMLGLLARRRGARKM